MVAIIFTALYGLGIPLGCMVCIASAIWQKGRYRAMRRWAFLTRALRDNRWYYELFIMVRKLLLVFAGVFVEDNYLQVRFLQPFPTFTIHCTAVSGGR